MLTERQLGIVLAVVYECIKNGEPSGSRTITKKYIKGFSPATIRNEMCALEDMDYFYQPHTSSGRLPTAKAYRLYVDSIMQRARAPLPEKNSLQKELEGKHSVEGLLAQVTEMLERLTDCVGVAAVSALDDTEIQRIDFVPISSSTVLLLIILRGGLVYQGHFSTSFDIDPDTLDGFAKRLNAVVAGRTWKDVRGILHDYARSGLEQMEDVCRSAIKSMEGLLDVKNYRFSNSGAQQILNLPDIADMLERCQIDKMMKISIGDETLAEGDSSIIFLPTKARGQRAAVGLIGPLRMDYERGISVLEGMAAAMESD